MEEKQAILVPCPNPFPTGSVNTMKQLFYTTKWGMILNSRQPASCLEVAIYLARVIGTHLNSKQTIQIVLQKFSREPNIDSSINISLKTETETLCAGWERRSEERKVAAPKLEAGKGHKPNGLQEGAWQEVRSYEHRKEGWCQTAE